ncbi:Rieske (2Fe-2S) protein [Nocardioides coralli]|uniref:Rieske (2Fe-2S) protein n=1 Tax=Nocardioides coralli TaxID=2872154 RepID=UPI001CA3AFBA|nr:Rieske (2Fe-2S) protein [Nocardioides coralli]QZY30656.1 Rieske (2Fe-2S) protein [Nocardioides coralli]
MTTPGLHRRHALTGMAGLGLGLPVLAACGGGDADTGAESPPPDDAGGAAGGLASTADVPVGGGLILEDERVVVTQPSEGDFKAFTAVCTHQGCLVGRVEGEQIQCPCHGSAFSIADGSVISGPATSPLDEVAISVDGEEISRS